MSKKSYPRVTTPVGTFIYPKLVEPDTKFVKPHGEYSTKFALVANDEATQAFVSQLEGILQSYIDENPDELSPAALKQASTKPVYDVEFDDEGEETGRLIFRFKLKAVVETANKTWSQKPRLFDAQANPIDDGGIDPWTGSEGKVNAEVFPYFMQSSKQFGLSMRIKGAQILKLVSGGGDSADDMGFGSEDGGFVAESSAASNGFDAEDVSDDDVDF